VFALLTGYIDPPAGVEIREGMNYNPYFPGGAISMARVLFDGLVEFDDSTSPFSHFAPPLTLMTCLHRNTLNSDPNGQRCRDVPELGR
jgi:hypothetical protein